jgi:hypothetical protein
MAALIRNGWQKLKPVRQSRGKTADRSGHFNELKVVKNRACGDFFVTKSLS